MAASVLALLPSLVAGSRLIDGADLILLVNILTSSTTGLKALAGGGQAGATVLTGAINEVTTVASGGDSVILVPATPGIYVEAVNHGAQSMNVFASAAQSADKITPTNSINANANNTGTAQASGFYGAYVCYKANAWKQQLSA